MLRARIVHVCNGDSTAERLADAGLPGELRVWADALDQGPVLPVADEEHYAARDAFHDERDAVSRIAAWDRGVDDAATADELVLWFEHDLFDQLALVRLLARLARRGRPRALTLVSIDRHPDVPGFLGLGQLTPAQLAALWPQRVAVSPAMIDEAIAAWIAVTAADPRALPFVAARVAALPFLAAALERQLEELPDPRSGLSRTERQVLDALDRGIVDAAALMAALHAIDPGYPITDRLLEVTLTTLGAAGLIDRLAVTPLGRDVLAGAIDRVHHGGIDTWRGGVLLSGHGPVWRWDRTTRSLSER